MGTETNSLFWKDEDTAIRSFAEDGSPCEGTRICKGRDGNDVILRFRNGLLDGDSFLRDGRRITQPAVETEGHVEYWREGMLHRDDGLAAVASNGFSEKEFWEHNKRIR